jgi:uncharacterized cupin superfamily protein
MAGDITHWDDVDAQRVETDHLRGTRRRLGGAMGAVRTGLSRFDAGPDERPMPVHVHADEEEILFVLRGSGVTTDGQRAWPIAAGDTVVHVADGAPHTFVAGAEGIDVLVFSTGSDTHLSFLPRARVMWAGSRWVPLDGPNPFKAENLAGPLVLGAPEAERPPHVVAFDDVPPHRSAYADVVTTRRRLGAAAGARRSGLSHVEVPPGLRSSVPHLHSANEELFLVLGGSGTLELWDTDGQVVSRHPVRPGSAVGRPASSGVGHCFVAGDEGIVLLMYDRQEPNDLCFYPRSQKVSIDGLGGIVFRIEQTTYTDGEPSPRS